MTNSFLYDLVNQMYIYSDTQEAPGTPFSNPRGKSSAGLRIRETASSSADARIIFYVTGKTA